MSNKKLYDSIPAGYYYYAFRKGNRVQKFWHKYKFMEIRSLMNLKDKKILDIGCGPGIFLSLLPKIYNSSIGLDISKKQINFARAKFFNYKNIKWIAKDFKSMSFKEKSFDYIIASEVIEHIPYVESSHLLKRIKLLLKNNGKTIITTPNYRSFWPLIEMIWNRIAKVSYEEQHINKLTILKVKKLLKKSGFNQIKVGTFFILSPFFAVLSEKLAKIIMRIEKKIFPSLGSIIIIEAS